MEKHAAHKKKGEAMNREQMLALSPEELHELSMKKTKRGVATQEALRAQKIIWERGGRGFTGNSMGEVACGPGNWCSIHYSYHRGKNMR